MVDLLAYTSAILSCDRGGQWPQAVQLLQECWGLVVRLVDQKKTVDIRQCLVIASWLVVTWCYMILISTIIVMLGWWSQMTSLVLYYIIYYLISCSLCWTMKPSTPFLPSRAPFKTRARSSGSTSCAPITSSPARCWRAAIARRSGSRCCSARRRRRPGGGGPWDG